MMIGDWGVAKEVGMVAGAVWLRSLELPLSVFVREVEVEAEIAGGLPAACSNLRFA